MTEVLQRKEGNLIRSESGSEPLRILYLVTSLEVGGLEVLVARMVYWIKATGAIPFVICTDRLGPIAEKLRKAGISVRSLDRPPRFSLKAVWVLTLWIRKGRFDIVHTHNWGAFVYGVIASFLVGVPGPVHTQHSLPDGFAGVRRFWGQLLGRRISCWVAVSDQVENFLKRSWCSASAELSRIVNGVEVHGEAGDKKAITGQQILSSTEAEEQIVSVGRLVEIKDHHSLLIAHRTVFSKHPNAVLVLVGDGPLQKALVRQAVELGIERSVRFLGYREDVFDILRGGARVFVLSSLSEGNSVALLEAMAAGLPVVATDVEGNYEVLQHGKNGLLVPPANPEALAAAVLSILEDSDLAGRLSESALETVKERFGFNRMMKEYWAIYQKVGQPKRKQRLKRMEDV